MHTTIPGIAGIQIFPGVSMNSSLFSPQNFMMWLHTNLCWCGYLIIFLPPFICCFLDSQFYPLFYPNFSGYFPAADDDVTNFFALLITGFNISSSNFSFNFSGVDSGCRLNCFLLVYLFFRYQEEKDLVVGGLELHSEFSSALVSSPRSGPGLGFYVDG